MRRIRDFRPAPGTVLGTIALFISLGGVSYGVAAGTIDSREIKNNSVGSKDIRNNTVRGKDTRNGSLTGSDVKNSSLTGSDVKNGSLTGSDVLESSLGTVPSANTAGTASFAGLAGATAGLTHASVTASYSGPNKTLFTINGFQVFLQCALGGVGGDSLVFLKNVSAGNNAAADADEANTFNGEDDDFDQGDQLVINSSGAGTNIDELGPFAAFGSKGAATGNIAVGSGLSGTLGNCAASGNGAG